MTGTNVAFVAIDDLFAYAQFRDSFGVTIQTPNLDRLMAEAVNFENAYASVAICAPSRAATMSGKTAFETGVHDNFTGLFDVVDPADTWPAMIRDNGYFATSAGKVFHSKGGTAGVQQAFSEPVTITRSTLTAERTLTEGGRKWAYQGPDEDFNDHDVAQFGIEFLNRAPTDQPFLLALGFDHPHTAYFNPARYFDLYPLDQIEIPTDWVQGDLSDTPAFAQQFMSQPRGQEPWSNLDLWKANVQGYLASISHMDAELGRFLDALAASEHAADTAIVIYSDHGYQLGAKDHPVKFTLWEESAKAPLMIWHPDLDGGKTVTTPVSLMDIMPTMLEMTGTAIPTGLTGQSLMSFITGEGETYDARPALTMMYGSFAIRSGDFRYIRYQDGSEELYNVVSDPGQNTNLAIDPAFATLATRLRADLLNAARDAGAVIDESAEILTGTDGDDNGVASPGNRQIALGDGDDKYHVFGNGTGIVETADGGFDSVYYMGSEAYLLPLNVERFYATQPDNRIGTVSAIGNEQANMFYTGYTASNFNGGGGNDSFFGGGWVSHTFHGGSGNDRLYGARQEDLLYGGDGADVIEANNKADRVFGGDGNDMLSGERGNDRIFGGTGDDRIFGGKDADFASGGDGADLIAGGSGDDRIEGGDGNDVISTGSGADSVDGAAGDDTITSNAGRDLLIGGDGADRYVIGPDAGLRVIDERGSAETDVIVFNSARMAEVDLHRSGDALLIQSTPDHAVWIRGAATNPTDTVIFSDAEAALSDLLAQATGLTEAPDGLGDESLTGTGHGDVILGLLGDDLIRGKGGNDDLRGGSGNDRLESSSGQDTLSGGTGDDMLFGGNDADLLTGGTGDDFLFGGQGADTYVYRLGDGLETIRDRGRSDGDTLRIEGVAERDVLQAQIGADLVLTLPDGGQIRIQQQTRDADRIESIVFTSSETPPTPRVEIQGTSARDRLVGTDAAERFVDGAGKDNLFGRGGADIFALSSDGVADAIKDFVDGEDLIDLSAWGVAQFEDLEISTHRTGKATIRFGSEVLSIDTATRRNVAETLTEDDFILG